MTAPITITDAMSDDALFGSSFKGESWNGWHAILKAAHGLPMTPEELAFFRSVAERDPPEHQVKELWIIAGRRAGKDSVASVIAAYSAAFFQDQHRLRPGERARVLCLACDRDQARIVLGFTRAYFADCDMLRDMVQNETKDGLELHNGIDIAIGTNSHRSIRGLTIWRVILDEVSQYRDDTSSTPDTEVYNAVIPGLASLPGSMLIGISSPYARRGLLFQKYQQHYGKDSADVLVIKAPTRVLNPTIPQSVIDAAMAEDPAKAGAEWMAEFRTDVESFLSREVIDACTVAGRHELPPVAGQYYVAFTDPSGGSSDSMTLAIGHFNRWSEKSVVDAVREVKPPFSPEAVVTEFAALLKQYNISTVRGDRYAGEWPRERFQVHGISYQPSPMPKSEIYTSGLLPILNSGRGELLDHPRCQAQMLSLVRSVARGGKDSVDHVPNAKDDIANAVAGVLQMAAENGRRDPDRVLLVGAGPPRDFQIYGDVGHLQ